LMGEFSKRLTPLSGFRLNFSPELIQVGGLISNPQV